MLGFGVQIFISCLVAVIVSSSFAANVPAIARSNRVVGGESVDIADRKYMVQLRDKKRLGLYRCAGTLVGKMHVVTAAHCVTGITPKDDLFVVGGSNTIFDDGVKRNVVASAIHPQYGIGHEFSNDTAILTLQSPMEGDNIQPIDMSFDDVEDEQFLEISGWGTTEAGVTGMIEGIRTARVAKIPQKECVENYSNYKKLTAPMICAATPGKDACQGDSGGPAIYRRKLYAIISWGKGCNNPDYPGVYITLKSVKEFIISHVYNTNNTLGE